MLAMGLSYLAFILLEYLPSIPIILRIYYHKGMLNLIRIFFSASVEMTMCILSFILLMCCRSGLWMLNHPCIPGVNETHLITVYDLCNCYFIHFATILFRIFASLFIIDIDLSFSFCVYCLCLALVSGRVGLLK